MTVDRQVLTDILVLSVMATLVCCATDRPTYVIPDTEAAVKDGPACAAASKCSDCIAKAECVWCIPEDPSQTSAQCLQRADNVTCQGSVVDPGSTYTIEEDSISEDNPTLLNTSISEDNPTLLTPQAASLSIRVGQDVFIPLKLHISENQALDLYYLSDISQSMQDDLDKLANLGKELEDALEKITTKFAMGFGTYIDKKVLPYYYKETFEDAKNISKCFESFSYCNVMPLKEKGGDEFTQAVASAQVLSNKDAPEGGLDALLQVALCTDAIKWRENSMRLVLYASDAPFHYAGDGKLAGIDAVNDAKCHLDPTNMFYTHSTLQDYPSVYQIGEAVKASNLHVIFAVTKGVIKIYEELSKHVPGSETAELLADSSNIIEVITEQYRKIIFSQKLHATAPDEVKVTFSYDCPEGGPEKCEGLTPGTNSNITARVSLLRCPDSATKNPTAKLYSTGLKDVIFKLDYICDCDCESAGVPSSPNCNKNGTYKCGQCHCDNKYYGDRCQCTGSESSLDKDKCKKENSTQVCSNMGDCLCGTCECNTRADPKEMYEGKFCECSNFGCKRAKGMMCGGHGNCNCDTCSCDEDWTGDSCDCHHVTTGCMETDDSVELCSGKGDCVCNSCKCHKTGHVTYFGSHCQDCSTCGGECLTLSECVKCKLQYEGDKTLEQLVCDAGNQKAHCKVTYSQLEGSVPDKSSLSTCLIRQGDCVRNFYYHKDLNGTIIFIGEKWNCKMATGLIVGITVGCTVLVGLLTLATWWILQLKKLAAEAKKMEDAGREAILASNAENENHIYRSPISEMSNPLYGREM